MKTLLQIINEAQEHPATLDAWEKSIGAEPVLEPDVITPIRKQWKETEPYMYTFLKKCVWYKVTKGGYGWGNTMGVAPFSNGIKFFYDEKFLHSLNLNELIFLLCHEAGHIFRFTHEREKKQHLNHDVMNRASDMVINHDLTTINKIGPWEAKMPEKTPGLMPPKEFIDEMKKSKNKNDSDDDFLKKGFLTSAVYRWLTEHPEQQEDKGEGEKKPLSVGDIVKINNENKHGRIKNITKNKSGEPEYEIEEINLQDEIDKTKEELKKQGKKV
jgi:hypothetical protein